MSSPKASVILATHNSIAHLSECLDSILSQKYQDIEVIAVDVGSTDGTKEYLADKTRDEDRIIYLADSMGSMGHAKNMALDRARGSYILIVEPEDYLYRDSLEYMCGELDDNPDNDMFSCETDACGDDSFGRTIKDRDHSIGTANRRDNRNQEMNSRVMRNWIFDHITMYRSSFLRDRGIRHYEEPGYGRQDIAFRFLTMVTGVPALSLVTQYERRMDVEKERITEATAFMDICNEFRFLKEKLCEDQKLWWQMRLVFWQAYYDRNMLLYEHLSDELRANLSKRMQADIKDAIFRKEYSKDHFDIRVREEMELLLKSASEFDRYQQRKIMEREKARDEALKREDRLTEIFVSPEESEIERLSRESEERMEELRRKNRLDRKWLLEEMTRDLAPLRLLLGLTPLEMGNILGVSESIYKSIEAGKREVTWDQYMALLFIFRYNDRTAPVTDTLGLYPEPLKKRMKKGIIYGYG